MRLFRQDAKVAALARAPLFEGLSKRELTELARLAEDMEVDAGTVLCKEGEPGREFFVIMEGDVEVKRRGRRLKNVTGAFFGEIALLEDLPRTATVTAATPVRMFVLTARDFRHVLDDHPSVERKVLRALAKRLADQVADPSLA